MLRYSKKDNGLPIVVVVALSMFVARVDCAAQSERPNVLVAISDDQSYPHASAYGQPVIQTPAFDQVARRGILFHNAFTPCPGCSPMRAAFLTGRHIWQNAEAGTHASSFPKELKCFTGQLAESGYTVGYTGKPWGPGNFRASGWNQNPVGPAYSNRKLDSPKGVASVDYAGNFEQFLDQSDPDEPFCFWYGGHEPHRSFGKGLGKQSGMDPSKVEVPSFLPDSEEVRSDLLDYFFEIQWFDKHLAHMLRTLETRGQLDNTIVIVTSDNGMSFPRAKANVYEYGIHMPLAISWPKGIVRPGRETHELVSLIDVTATIHDLCQLPESESRDLSGTSLRAILEYKDHIPKSEVFAGRERHSSSRYNSLGYPSRCVRTPDYLYIRNYAPERWPAGAPQKYARAIYDGNNQLRTSELGPEDGGYHDIDSCPTLDWMIANRGESHVAEMLKNSVGKRPSEEFYAIGSDPGCLHNLADLPEFTAEKNRHRGLLEAEQTATGDLRHTDFVASQVWERYPRYSSLRWFPIPEWAQENPSSVPQQDWLDSRRPKAK